MSAIAKILALLAAVSVLSGCATTDSDMPWNTPASWQNNPSIPGFSYDD